MAEIVRAGIILVDEGQTEQPQLIGLPAKLEMMCRIVLPQAMRIIIPPTGNETISMLKTTSLVSTIAVAELFQAAQDIASSQVRGRTPAHRGQPLVPLLHLDLDGRAVLRRAPLRPGRDPGASSHPVQRARRASPTAGAAGPALSEAPWVAPHD